MKHLPGVIFVKFSLANGEECACKLDGTTEYGLYLIVPKKSDWFLDKGRRQKKLKISRRQVPLAPAFAVTSHAAQGQTMKKGAVVDLRIGRGTKAISSYVAITRVENRKKLLIYRPFERERFTQGQQEGPELLLKHLRGEWRGH